MPSCPIVSSDLRAHIPILCHVYGYSIQKICCVLGVGKTLVYKTLKVHWTLDGPHSLVLAGKKTGRRRTLTPADVSFIKGLLIQKHTMYIDEIQQHLFLHHGASVSITTIFQTLHHLDFSNKAISAQALEQNEMCHAHYMNCIGAEVPDPKMLMFIDEAAKNDKTGGCC